MARRFTNGLTLNAQYTLARSFGNTSGSNEALTAANNANPNDLSQFDYDLGYNSFDIRHSFNISALYALPFGHGKNLGHNMGGVGQALLGNWEIGGIINGRSGMPLDLRITRNDVVYEGLAGTPIAGKIFQSPQLSAGVVQTQAIINTPGGGASRNVRRPDLVPGVDPFLHSGGLAFLNPAAFAVPAPGTFGNLQRGSLHGPSFNQVDLTLGKRFPITEAAGLEFRTEVFNLFNKPNFQNPPATLPASTTLQPGQAYSAATAGTFGIINSIVGNKNVGIGTNRQIQFALRFTF